ncbi:MAG: hypothetical protein JSV38_12595 [Desulfobacterales bacterium]|nr:MAG: hypothetical protein JSV38_12595 [Desulfobacterales bacterium]
MRKIIFLLFILLLTTLGCKEDVLNLKIRYDHIQGLQKGDRVLFEQNHIGVVKSVVYSKKGFYMVDIAILKNFANTATEHSRFFIVTDPQNKEKMAVEMTHARKGGSLLKNNTVLEGATKTSAFFDQFFDEFFEGFEDLKKEVEQLAKDFKGIPESEEFKKLEDELRRLKEDMVKSGEEVKEKIRTEFLPRLREEMEALRERLRKLGCEDELKPLEIEMEDLEKI